MEHVQMMLEAFLQTDQMLPTGLMQTRNQDDQITYENDYLDI